MRRARPARWVLLVLALVSCGQPPGPGAGSSAGDPTQPRSARPTLTTQDGAPIEVRPAAVRPGREAELRFPEAGSRGVAFSLEAWTGDGWRLRYSLSSDGGDLGWEPSWWSVDDAEGRGWNDVGVSGPGPDRIVVPATAPAGTYRLCTANALQRACGLLVVG